MVACFRSQSIRGYGQCRRRIMNIEQRILNVEVKTLQNSKFLARYSIFSWGIFADYTFVHY